MGFHENELVKLRILVNNEEVDALSSTCHKDQAEYRGRATIQPPSASLEPGGRIARMSRAP